MSLMSKVDTLKAKAQQDGANELDLMRAALVESQERYNQQAAQISLMLQRYDKRIEAIEKAVERSNEQKYLNIQAALETASQAVMEPIQRKSADVIHELDKAEVRMLKAKEAADRSDTHENIRILGALFGVFFVATLLSSWIYWSFSSITDMVIAVNNGMYQLLQK